MNNNSESALFPPKCSKPADAKQWVTILGATGSIGVSTLDVIQRHSDRFGVYALTANTQAELLLQQCLSVQQCLSEPPRYAVLKRDEKAQWLARALKEKGCATEVLVGENALIDVASADAVDCVMAAIVGGAGLAPTMAAAQAGKKVLLANKESLVMAGSLFMKAVADSGAVLLPIDSEHNAIFQCLPASLQTQLAAHPPEQQQPWPQKGVESLLLTGSGGPFRTWSMDQLQDVTPEQACAHPNWSMGQKISVDSSTLMNKGLEFIEACWLFSVPPEKIQVVLHPQSVIHSMVQYTDGSVLAQMGQPDMRTPIAHALAWPERMASGVAPLDLLAVARLDFDQPDTQRFPCLRLAMEVAGAGASESIVLNAANEIAVDAFLSRQIRYLQIPALVEEMLQSTPSKAVKNLEAVHQLDSEVRRVAKTLVKCWS